MREPKLLSRTHPRRPGKAQTARLTVMHRRDSHDERTLPRPPAPRQNPGAEPGPRAKRQALREERPGVVRRLGEQAPAKLQGVGKLPVIVSNVIKPTVDGK